LARIEPVPHEVNIDLDDDQGTTKIGTKAVPAAGAVDKFPAPGESLGF
jgi:hypothetical protein